jgi:N-acetylglucosaminyldiphosphoundecaprenol N-acetyl-beta-D-mannosaminyltransferase
LFADLEIAVALSDVPRPGPQRRFRRVVALTSVRSVDILGVDIDAMTMPLALEIVEQAVQTRGKVQFAFCTVHTLIESQDDSRLASAVNNAVACPDGMPLVWICRLKGAKGTHRVYGPDATLALCEYGVSRGWRHYFYGSTEETVKALADSLTRRFPGLQVAGYYSPPFRQLTAEEDAEIVANINAARADLVWVGLGMPKQELWMAEHAPLLEAPVVLAVGAAFDFHSGAKRQAPYWIQRSGLEWLFRLSQEPRRLWRRYLLGNARFLWLLFRELSPWYQRR